MTFTKKDRKRYKRPKTKKNKLLKNKKFKKYTLKKWGAGFDTELPNSDDSKSVEELSPISESPVSVPPTKHITEPHTPLERTSRFDTELPSSDDLKEPSYRTWKRNISDLSLGVTIQKCPAPHIISALFYLIKVANLKKQLDFIDQELRPLDRELFHIYVSPQYAHINMCSRILKECQKRWQAEESKIKPSKSFKETLRTIAKKAIYLIDVPSSAEYVFPGDGDGPAAQASRFIKECKLYCNSQNRQFIRLFSNLFHKIPLTTTSFVVYRCNRVSAGLDKIPMYGNWNYGGFLSTTLNIDYAKAWCEKGKAARKYYKPELLKITIPARSSVIPLIDTNKIYNPKFRTSGNKETLTDRIGTTFDRCFLDKDEALVQDLKRQRDKFYTPSWYDIKTWTSTEYEILLSNEGHLVKTGEEKDHKNRTVYLFAYRS